MPRKRNNRMEIQTDVLMSNRYPLLFRARDKTN